MKKEQVEKIKNWWWYHKVHVLIAVAVIAVIIYFSTQTAGKPKPDYSVALLLATPCEQEYPDELCAAAQAAGTDLNGDGEVLVQINTYFVDLADESENAGYNNYEKIAKLDADLIGHTSGIFITDTPDVLQAVTDGIFLPAVPFSDGLWLCQRADADSSYTDLASAINAP